MDGYLRQIRKLVGSRRIIVPGVRALILENNNRLLLQLRLDMDQWGLPGGAVEIGETALEALKREVKEETGLEVIKADPMALFSGKGQQFTYPNGDQVQGFALAFVVKKWKGQPSADGLESDKLQFFDLSRLPRNIMPVHRLTIEEYQNKYKGSFLLSE
jgi:ADP-ribose pyrophosphatase YjhB (NUDIX family)